MSSHRATPGLPARPVGHNPAVRRSRIVLILLAAGAGVVALVPSLGGDAARDVTKALDLRGDPPFAIRLSGPLWRDRTLRDADGAPDLGYVTADEGLDMLARGAGHARVAEVLLRVDGRLQRRVRPPCPGRVCPTQLALALKPRLTGPASADRRVEVTVRDRRGMGGASDVDPHTSVAKFTVYVGKRLPRVREGEPVTASTIASAPSEASERRLRTSGLRVLSALRRRGSLDALLGTARLHVSEAGELKVNGRSLGVSLLLELSGVRRNVRATVPAYIPATNFSSGYRAQTVRLQAPVLRDLLVDVDLDRNRVIALEPGPRSQTKVWAPSFAPTPFGAADED
jgi:hypothetical protein